MNYQSAAEIDRHYDDLLDKIFLLQEFINNHRNVDPSFYVQSEMKKFDMIATICTARLNKMREKLLQIDALRPPRNIINPDEYYHTFSPPWYLRGNVRVFVPSWLNFPEVSFEEAG